MPFRLHFPHLAPNDRGEFAPSPKWAELRAQYAEQYPEWESRAQQALQRLGLKLRKAWPYHRARIHRYFQAIAAGSNAVERLPGALAAYQQGGGQHGSSYQANIQELTYKGYILSSFALAGSVNVADRPDSKFVLWRGHTALTTRGACFASAHLGYALKFQRDADAQLIDIQRRTDTMNKGTQAAKATPRRGVRA